MCITTLNVDVVKRWAELALPEEISEAIDIPSSTGTALCMAAALKKDRETGKLVIWDISNRVLSRPFINMISFCNVEKIALERVLAPMSHVDIKLSCKL